MDSHAANTPPMTMLDEIGGRQALEGLVAEFYRRVLENEYLAEFFTQSNMDIQQRRLEDALVLVLGGEQRRYEGLQHLVYRLGQAHGKYKIQETDFETVAGILVTVCVDYDVPSDTIDHLINVVEDVKGQIVTV